MKPCGHPTHNLSGVCASCLDGLPWVKRGGGRPKDRVKTGPDPVIKKCRQLFMRSGKTLDQLGMGGRQIAWQFLNKVRDPRLSTVRKFAVALGIDLEALFA